MTRFMTKVLATVAIVMPAMLFAATPEPVQQHNSNAVWFENWVGLSNAEMVVVAPNGRIETILTKTGTPVYRLNHEEVIDGIYRFELKAATEEEVEIVNPIDNGRGDSASNTLKKPFYFNGFFVVSRNVIVTQDDVKED
jgi:hypothetical protein